MTVHLPSRKNPRRMLSLAGLEGIPFYKKHEDHILVLGAITVQWSTMERLLFEMFRFMIKQPQSVAAPLFYLLPSHSMRRNLVRHMASQKISETNLVGVLAILDQVADCAARRNQLTHDAWMHNDKAGSVVRQKSGIVADKEEDIFNEPIAPLIEFHKKMMRVNQSLNLAVLALAGDPGPTVGSHRHKSRAGDSRKVR